MFHVPGMHTRRIEQHGEPVFSGQLLLSYCNAECRGKTPFSENETRPARFRESSCQHADSCPQPASGESKMHSLRSAALPRISAFVFTQQGICVRGPRTLSANPTIRNSRMKGVRRGREIPGT